MGGGLAFLTKKSFNPANWSNQRRVWEARQESEREKRRISEREAQLKREREEEELARVVGGEEEGGRKALGFMYDAGRIPGLNRENKNEEENGEIGSNEEGADAVCDTGGGTILRERQPGDDDAAAAFRAMLARGTTADDGAPSTQSPGDSELSASRPVQAASSGTEAKDNRTNLEKAVGRGINAGSGVTLAQQIERFPMLKGAPMALQKSKSGGVGEGDNEGGTDVAGLNFKPLGQVLRNVQCLKCGKWGHARGDRECELSGWDPFRVSSAGTFASPLERTSVKPSAENSANGQPKQQQNGNVSPFDQTSAERVNRPERSDRKQKKEKKRRKNDRRKSKKRRRRRSPSYSSDTSTYSLAKSSDSDDDSRSRHRHHNSGRDSRRRSKYRDEIEDIGYRERSRHKSSSRHHHKPSRKRKRTRRRSRSPSLSSSNYSHSDDGSSSLKKRSVDGER